MDWLQHPDRRREDQGFEGDERRKSYSHGELPPDPTPGDPGADARDQQGIERRRESERERSEGTDNKPGPYST